MHVTPAVSPSWHLTQTPTTSLLFAVDVVNPNVVWAAGGPRSPGVVVRTVDGGEEWEDVTPQPDGPGLDFHDVEAFDRNHAVVLAVGEGAASRIYRTTNGGVSWQLVFQNEEPTAFYDSMAFFDHRRGLAVSDPVEGLGFFRIVSTEDGGQNWTVASTEGMPPALTGEFAHATGTSLVTMGSHDAWFGTTSSRVFHTRDGGSTWTVATTPIPIPDDPDEFGVASLSFQDPLRGLALGGGDRQTNAPSVVAITDDGGDTWSEAGTLAGFRLSVAWVPTNTNETAVAVGAAEVGPAGSEFSTDGGQTWSLFNDTDLRSINCKPHVACWAVGQDGMAAELTLTAT
jgi:photosystem II stability/assembly factor-like uncharacterized protein